ncbi:hypothetical protein Q9L42_003390 [Methylomarinum sp. Ch1-1]|uniref:DUF4890 domain-containing protein n=1 Tax=Methylomarinum roseum TaxID=3067653 RepID=A0AAU7NW09_9GAMM|nr:hypothetical protein [Methylomarinum sp. Ch1-1]MDP4522767.1 hypothetical protein [Methylomarinum sp. Ch1-1]
MKRLIAIMGLVLFSLSLQAQDKPGSMSGMQGMQGKGQMQMSEEQRDAHMRAKQEQMLIMHDYYNRILAEEDPAKKQKLKDEQLELMKAHHRKMREHKQQMKKMHKKMMNK